VVVALLSSQEINEEGNGIVWVLSGVPRQLREHGGLEYIVLQKLRGSGAFPVLCRKP